MYIPRRIREDDVELPQNRVIEPPQIAIQPLWRKLRVGIVKIGQGE
jgi:hypothetical protein